MPDTEKLHTGHRQRMKKKLALHEHTIFATYELLEMLLYYIIPYRDTKPTAKRLLAACGSLDGVLSAAPSELMSVSGVGERTAEFISGVGRVTSLCLMPPYAEERAPADRYETVGEMLVGLFGDGRDSATYALFLDNSMRPIATEKIADCDLASGAVTAKPFIELALKHGASVVITAHNHPFGPLFITPGDFATQTLLERELRMAGIVVAEHYIISGKGYIGTKDNIRAGAEKLPLLKRFSAAGRGTRIATGRSVPEREGMPEGAGELIGLFTAFVPADEAERSGELLFGAHTSLPSLLSASRTGLTELLSDKPQIPLFLKLLAGIASRRLTDKTGEGDELSPEGLAEYLRGLFFGKGAEAMYLIALDGRGRLLGSECLGEGAVNSFSVNSRRLLECATALGADTVILAHNHPRGVNEPSEEDILTTVKLEKLLLAVGIKLGGHYIVTECGVSLIDGGELMPL